jgi:hypothetical protein
VSHFNPKVRQFNPKLRQFNPKVTGFIDKTCHFYTFSPRFWMKWGCFLREFRGDWWGKRGKGTRCFKRVVKRITLKKSIRLGLLISLKEKLQTLSLYQLIIFTKMFGMETVTIDKKKYVIVEQKQFEELQKIAASKTPPQKKLSSKEGKAHAYQLIEAWVKEK